MYLSCTRTINLFYNFLNNQKVENLVSFSISERYATIDPLASVGRQLSYLCSRHAIVAHGFLLWANDRFSSSVFVGSAAFSSLAPGILGLARISATNHVPMGLAVLELALVFLGTGGKSGGRDADVSFRKATELRRMAVRLLLVLCTCGVAVDVLYAVSDAISDDVGRGLGGLKGKKNNATGGREVSKTFSGQGQGERGRGDGRYARGSVLTVTIDASLLRYFLFGMFEIFRPPYSRALAAAVINLLSKGVCVDAILRSPSGHEDGTDIAGKLLKMVVDLQKAVNGKGKIDNLQAAVKELGSLYGGTNSDKSGKALAVVV